MHSANPLPISRTVERLLAQVQAEAQAATLEALSTKDGIVVLHALEAPQIYFSGDNLEAYDLRNGRATGYRVRQCPNSWLGSKLAQEWHPAHWYVSFYRVDGAGHTWSRDAGPHVVDDFGTLVCVEGGAA